MALGDIDVEVVDGERIHETHRQDAPCNLKNVSITYSDEFWSKANDSA
ncbi:MAG: hypothetical protein ACOYLH_12495 [Flavobacteriales bacterium]|jgi:hypothetical protein